MQVLSHHSSKQGTESFTVDIEGYKYTFTEWVTKEGFSKGFELLNEHGRQIKDTAIIGVVQNLIDRYLYEKV
jgi:hypothetical protein